MRVRANNYLQDTIAAAATPPGCGGVGIIRISGNKVKSIARAILGNVPQPRYAHHSDFKHKNNIIDIGIAIYFSAPNSFTGEDVLELHGHGSPVVLDNLLRIILKLGARLATPGEFSERAFLNNKVDLTQAEAIADLVNASSIQAAKSALQSLQGGFSKQINILVEQIIALRTQVEAAIDFSNEEINLPKRNVLQNVNKIINELKNVQQQAEQGRLLQEGISVVIAGKPNVGKSSLMNYLTGHNSAIVTNIPGTTRDILREHINLDGLPLHIIDTAGLRKSMDTIEQEGIKRAWQEIALADFVWLLVDNDVIDLSPYQQILDKLVVLRNKIDLINGTAKITKNVIHISAKTGAGIDLLKKHLINKIGFNVGYNGKFIARRRHLEALSQAEKHFQTAKENLINNRTIDLVAEDLRQAQNALGQITGMFYTEDLLDRIFSEFCIGK